MFGFKYYATSKFGKYLDYSCLQNSSFLKIKKNSLTWLTNGEEEKKKEHRRMSLVIRGKLFGRSISRRCLCETRARQVEPRSRRRRQQTPISTTSMLSSRDVVFLRQINNAAASIRSRSHRNEIKRFLFNEQKNIWMRIFRSREKRMLTHV